MPFRSIVLRASAVLACACMTLLPASAARADWPVDGTPVVVLGGIQGNFHAIADGAGGVYVAWEDSRAGLMDIYLQRLTRAGVPYPGWPASGAPVCTYTGTQTAARLCLDGAGGVYVGFVDQSAGPSNSNIQLQRVTGDGQIAPGWPSSSSYGLLVCYAPNRQNTIKMVEDGAGGVYLAWLDYRFGGGPSDVAFTRFLADGSVADGWPDNGLDPFNEIYGEEAHVLLGDGAGGLWVGWADARNAPYSPTLSYDIALTHMNPNGNAVLPYPAAGLYVTAIAGPQYSPAMVSDGEGGLLFAFRDTRTTGVVDLYATRVDANCDVHAGWPARSTGLPLSTASADQDQPLAVSDGAGGMIVLWRDYRTSPTYRLYATRVTGAATIASGWGPAAAGGTAVCPVDADQQHQAILEDGAGGAYVAWRDQRSGEYDVYATRLTGDGGVAAGWPTTGVVVSAATGAQQTPQLVSDGGGGAYVVWSDYRTDSGDLYAAHLTPAGLAAPGVGVPVSPPARVELRLASPSPSAGGARFVLALPRACTVRAAVLDAAGRRVRTLATGAFAAGTHTLAWDGLSDDGATATAGLYFVTVTAGAERRSSRLVVTR